jgi:hypothetical protein
MHTHGIRRRVAAGIAITTLAGTGLALVPATTAPAAITFTCLVENGSTGALKVNRAVSSTPAKVKKISVKIDATLRGCTGSPDIVLGKLKAKFKRSTNDCAFLSAPQPFTGKVSVVPTNAAGRRLGKIKRSGTFQGARLFDTLIFYLPSSNEFVGVKAPSALLNAACGASTALTYTGPATAQFTLPEITD